MCQKHVFRASHHCRALVVDVDRLLTIQSWNNSNSRCRASPAVLATCVFVCGLNDGINDANGDQNNPVARQTSAPGAQMLLNNHNL